MSTLVGRVASVAVFVLVVGPLGVAGATRGGKVGLREPGDAMEAARTGVMDLRTGSRGERLRVRVRGLDAAREYELRDRNSSESLGSFVTNRGGAGRMRLLAEPEDSYCGRMMDVVVADDGTVALEGEEPLPEMHGDEACGAATESGHDAGHHDQDAVQHGSEMDDHHGDGSMHGDGAMHDGGSMHGGSGGHM